MLLSDVTTFMERPESRVNSGMYLTDVRACLSRRWVNVGFGSLAVVQHSISRMSAIGRKADAQQDIFEEQSLDVRSHQKRSFRRNNSQHHERLLTATSGHKKTPPKKGGVSSTRKSDALTG